MPDVNVSDLITLNEGAGQNLLRNPGFEVAPSFIAATTTNNRFIEGNAAGSTTNDTYYWAT